MEDEADSQWITLSATMQYYELFAELATQF